MANQVFKTVVSKGGSFSIHSSFKAACADYDWDHESFKGRFQSEIGDYTIKKHPEGTTIDCIELINFIARKGVKTKVDNYSHMPVCLVDVTGYNKEYRIEFRTQDKNLIALNNVWIISDETASLSIKFDSYTEKELLNLINLD